MFHSGTFHSLGLLCYVGGSVAHIDYCDPDEMSMLEVHEMVKELGLESVDKLYYNRNGANNCTALYELDNDMDATNLGCFKDNNMLVGVYVSHVQDPRGGEDENENENESQMVVIVPKSSNEQTHHTNFSQNEFADVTLSDESEDLQSIGSDSDLSEKFVDSESELEDDDDLMFDENVDDEAEWSGLRSKETLKTRGASSSRVSRVSDFLVKRSKISKDDQEGAPSEVMQSKKNKEKPSKADKKGAPAGVKKPSKKTSKANLPHSTTDGANDSLASVPDEWWNVTSLEQASQLTKDSSKPLDIPSRVTRSRAAAAVDEAIKQSQEKQSGIGVSLARLRKVAASKRVSPVRVTPSRSAKKRIAIETNQKCTQESSCVAGAKPPQVRR